MGRAIVALITALVASGALFWAGWRLGAQVWRDRALRWGQLVEAAMEWRRLEMTDPDDVAYDNAMRHLAALADRELDRLTQEQRRLTG